jgi:hypothetical protein
MNYMTIPNIRKRMKELAIIHNIQELDDLAEASFRRPPVRMARRQLSSLNPALEKLIVDYANDNPTASYTVMARHFGVNIGRVSEALAGFKT